MIGALVVSQGRLAAELVDAATRIVGSTDGIVAVSLEWDTDAAAARESIGAALESLGPTTGTLILTDMFGGTPTNVSLTFLEAGRVEIVTGVNLPMLVKLTSLQGSSEPLVEIARQVRDRGQKSVYVASELLSSQDQS